MPVDFSITMALQVAKSHLKLTRAAEELKQQGERCRIHGLGSRPKAQEQAQLSNDETTILFTKQATSQMGNKHHYFHLKPFSLCSFYLPLLLTHALRPRFCSLQLHSPSYRCWSFTVSILACRSWSCKDSISTIITGQPDEHFVIFPELSPALSSFYVLLAQERLVGTPTSKSPLSSSRWQNSPVVAGRHSHFLMFPCWVWCQIWQFRSGFHLWGTQLFQFWGEGSSWLIYGRFILNFRTPLNFQENLKCF